MDHANIIVELVSHNNLLPFHPSPFGLDLVRSSRIFLYYALISFAWWISPHYTMDICYPLPLYMHSSLVTFDLPLYTFLLTHCLFPHLGSINYHSLFSPLIWKVSQIKDLPSPSFECHLSSPFLDQTSLPK